MSILTSQNLCSPYLGASPTSTSSFSEHETDPRACGEIINVDFSLDFENLSVNEEFFDLPIVVQQKYISTLERLRFARSSHVEESTTWPTHGCSPQTSQPSNICQTSTFPSFSKPDSFNLNLSRSHRPTLSLAERRGISLAHIKSQRLPLQNSQRQNFNPTTPSSVLSPQPSLLGKIDSDSFMRDERPKVAAKYRKVVRLDASGLVIQKDSPIYGSDPSPKFEGSLSSLPDCAANRRLKSNMDDIIWHGTKGSAPGTGISTIFDSLIWMENEHDSNQEFTIDDYYVNMNKIMASPTNKHRAKPTLPRSASTNETSFSDITSLSPILSPKIDSVSRQLLRRESRYGTRSRARSLATSSLMNKNSMSHHQLYARDSWELMRSEKQVDNYIQAIPRSSKPISTSEVSFGSKESYLTLNFDENDNPLLLDELSLSDMRYSTDDDLILSPYNIPTPQRYECPSTSASTKPVQKQNENSHSGVMKPIVLKKIDSPLASGNKGMTLRMTLTRPDLRLDESKIYAWQDSKYPSQIQYSSESIDDLNEKSTIKGPLGGPDGWGPEEREEGVVKRLWNKVTHSRKVP